MLTVARHENERRYWEGGNYELNMSFAILRDQQWSEVMRAIWEHAAIAGPLVERYTPGITPGGRMAIQVPPPTAALIQHGQLKIGEAIVGCDIQATRSLFECVSVLVPVGMFEGVAGGAHVRWEYPALEALDEIFYDIALSVYDLVPFQIAAIGYERSCQLASELSSDGELRHNFLVTGNFLAQDDVLLGIEPDLTPYTEVRSHLRWMAPKN
jgi:hypothetical protein